VGVNPANLTVGQHTGTITVAGTGTATGSTTINVTITVTAPLPTITRFGNAASYLGGEFAPGEIITVIGTGIGPTPDVRSARIDPATGRIATSLGGVEVLIDGIPVPVTYASNTQVNAIVPYEMAGRFTATLLVRFLGQTSNALSATVVAAHPGVFTANSTGSGPAAIINQNQSFNSPGNPARPGEAITLFITGEGQTSPPGVTGRITTISATPPLTPTPLLPVGVLIDGQPANVFFFGEVPNFVAGIAQINLFIPANARAGDLSLVVNIGGRASQTGVTVSVR
jgi:uncharacterized protein (TIGR03437 family)